MLTKYTLTIGATTYDIPDECLKNWDDIAFSLKRTDYSGVMRSFSTEFVFVGDIKDMLWELYLADGFLASASVSVYTITDTHEWELQYSAALDFSTLEVGEGTLTVNALDNSLAALLKSKKSQKYQYPVSDFSITRVNVTRMELASYAGWMFPVTHTSYTSGADNYMTALLSDNASQIISKEYLEPCDEIWNYSGSDNRFFATVKHDGFTAVVKLTGFVRCYMSPTQKGGSYGWDSVPPITYLHVTKLIEASGGGNTETTVGTLLCDDLFHKTIHGNSVNMLVNFILENPYSTLEALKSAALTRFDSQGSGRISNDYNGIFGVVGSVTDYTTASYWQNNTIYEYQNGSWINKGAPENYYQDRSVADLTGGYNGLVTVPLPAGNTGAVLCLKLTGGDLYLQYAAMTVNWSDPIRNTLSCRCIPPLQLITKIVRSITGEETSVSIGTDTTGLLAKTMLLPGEELRQITGAKVYSTFQNFADWMEAVFGYTYRVVGDGLQFVHRSVVFPDSVAKVIGNFRDVSYSVVDDLIYSQVEAGYSKKEYGEIDGRLEKNFTNYYTTGYSLTDKKLSLISKYRADSYGIEFTARKSESETKDDKADEDVFFVRIVTDTSLGTINYAPTNNDAYNPSVCVSRNEGFIAVPGNGAAVALTMTSSDGDNTLSDVEIAAGAALFTAGELDFTTDDMEMPSDLNGLVQLDYKGYRYTGFIKEAECRYGRRNGVEYKLIVKEITEI